VHGRVVSDLAEDDVAAVKPASLYGGDEKLRAVAIGGAMSVLSKFQGGSGSGIRVGAGVGHGEKTRAGVLLDEVLIGELLTVDGLATGALLELASKLRRRTGVWMSAHVAAGKVTTLEHEIRNDAVESRALVAEAVLAGAQLTEVAGGLGDDVIVESESDAAALLCFVRLADGV